MSGWGAGKIAGLWFPRRGLVLMLTLVWFQSWEGRKLLKYFYKEENRLLFFKKKEASSLLILRNKITKRKVKKQAEIGSPCRAPRFKPNYCVVLWPLITQGSWLFNRSLIHAMKFSRKLNFFSMFAKNAWSIKSQKLFQYP